VELVLSHERLVVECVEVVSFTLVWALGRVADHVSVVVGPTVVVVAGDSLLVVELVNEHVLFLGAFLQGFETLNEVGTVVETRGEYKSFISVLSAIGQDDLVLVREVLGDSGANVSSGPGVNLGGDGAGFELKIGDVTMGNTEVGIGHDELALLGDESHLVVNTLSLDEFCNGSSVDTT